MEVKVMRVVIDISRMHTFSKKRGIGFYTKLLFTNLEQLSHKKKDFEIILNESKEIDYRRYDLVHFPYYDFYFNTLPWQPLAKSIVTIHDVIPLRFQKLSPPGLRGKIKFFWQKFKLNWIKAVITDSKASKRDIIKFLGIKREKINVIYLAARSFSHPSENQIREIKNKYQLPDNFLLYVGDINYHKNLKSLILALRYLPEEINLVMVGNAFKRESVEKSQLKTLIQRFKLDSRIKMIGFVPDKDLAALYRLAKFYIQPSLWEGFGLPVIEALKMGTRIIVANNSSLREIVPPNIATFIAYPFNGKKIALAVRKAYQNYSNIRGEDLMKAAEKFTWQKTAQQTYQVYKTLHHTSKV